MVSCQRKGGSNSVWRVDWCSVATVEFLIDCSRDVKTVGKKGVKTADCSRDAMPVEKQGVKRTDRRLDHLLDHLPHPVRGR